VRHIAVGHRTGLVEDLGEDMKVAEAHRIAVVVVENPAGDRVVEDDFVEDNSVEDNSVADNSVAGSFAEGSSAERIAAGYSPVGHRPAEEDMRVVEADTVVSGVVHTAAAVEGSEGRIEGDVGHMEVAKDLKCS